jgi:hypothetical protein
MNKFSLKKFNEYSIYISDEYKQYFNFTIEDIPVQNRIITISTQTKKRIENIIREISPGYIKYISDIETIGISLVDWPIYIWKEMMDESDWDISWKEIPSVSHEGDSKKVLQFFIKLENLEYNLHDIHLVSIMEDDDGYFYVGIKITGKRKYYKCDQEYGLKKCLSNLSSFEMINF